MTGGPSSRLPLRTKIAWGIGGAADNLIPNALATLALPIYNLLWGVDVVLVGIALAIPRFLDAVTDPWMGNISDGTRTRWGRRRPFIFTGALLCAALFPLFWVPLFGRSEMALFWQLLVVGCVYSLAYTVFVIPYTALGYELTSDYDDRTRLLAWRMYLGLVVGLSIPWLYKLTFLPALGENQHEAVLALAGMIALLIALCGLPPSLALRERVFAPPPGEPLSLGKSLRTALGNRAFRTILAGYCAVLIGLFTVGSLALYINIFVICGGDKEKAAALAGLGGMITAVGAYLGLLSVAPVAAHFGKKAAMLSCLSVAVVGSLSLTVTLTPSAPYLQLVSFFIQGVGLQGAWLMVSSMVADVCDQDELQTGLRREGLFSAVTSFVLKLMLSVTALTGGVVLRMCGYQEGVFPSASSQAAMTAAFIFIPALLIVGAMVVFSRYPITREIAEATGVALGRNRPTA